MEPAQDAAPMSAERPTVMPRVALPSSFGHVAADGSVFLRLPDGNEHLVGTWATGNPEQAMEFFTRKYEDLITEIDLAAKRLADDRSTPAQALATAARVRQSVLEPAFVGDLAALVARIGQLEVLVNVKKAALADAKQQDKAKSLAERQTLVDEAEKLADSDGWKVTNERFKAMVEEWKAIPRVDRGVENDLWKRLSAARTAFDKRRRVHYAELEATRDEAKSAKEALVKEAQALATSKDWATTTRKYRELLDKWKKAGRAGKADDALWDKFRAAQDGFFVARNEQYAARSEEETTALATKEELLTEAEKLIPVKDARSAKRALRTIQEKWDKAGRVPRGDLKRIEARLKKVEDTVRAADGQKAKSANPELRGRAADTVSGFQESVNKLQKQLEKAKESGNEPTIAKAQASYDSAKMLLDAAARGLAKFGG